MGCRRTCSRSVWHALGSATWWLPVQYLQEAVDLARELGNERELTAALNALAMLHRLEGRLDKAAPICEQVLALTRELGDQEYIAIALLNLAMVSIGSTQMSAPD